MIALKEVKKYFDSKIVLNSISLNLSQGHTHVLLGSSGCGKSTLLRLILGLIAPNEGEIHVEGIDVGPGTQAELAAKIGYVVQEGGLFPHFTAQENVSLVARTRHWPREGIKARVWELTQLMGLESSLLCRYPKELSGGQRQRVGLMRALMLDPSLLLLDEPLGALDPIVRAGLQTELKRIFNRVKKTVIIVTHDIGEAAFFGHTITLLHEGRLIQHGPFEDFVRKPASPFVTEFINAQRPVPELRDLV